MTMNKDEISKYFSELGKKGSKTTNERYKDQKKLWGIRGAKKRWGLSNSLQDDKAVK